MNKIKQENHSTVVNAKEITEADYDLGCSILASSIRCFFSKPGIKEEYEVWVKSEENNEKMKGA